MPHLDPTWRAALHAHLVHLSARGASPRSVAGRASQLARAFDWLLAQHRPSPHAVTTADLERYGADLAVGGTRCPATCRNHLTGIKVFFRELRHAGGIVEDPGERLGLPPPSSALPRKILSAVEVDALRHVAYRTGRNRIRNRTLVEVLYATGIRRAECTALTVGDIDFQRQTLFVRHGKGRRQRYLPIAPRALRWIAAYLRRVRRLDRNMLDRRSPLFAGRRGRPLSPSHLTDLTKTWMRRAGVHGDGACHLFRHAMATHMLDHGADVRFIQAMLGHADLSTTMRYTQVSIRGLAEVYRRTHPAAFT